MDGPTPEFMFGPAPMGDPLGDLHGCSQRRRAGGRRSDAIAKWVQERRRASRLQRMSGTRGSGVPTMAGPNALSRALKGMMGEGVDALRDVRRPSSEAPSNGDF